MSLNWGIDITRELVRNETFWPYPRPKCWENYQVFLGKVELCVDFTGPRAHCRLRTYVQRVTAGLTVAEALQVRDMERKD